MSVYDALLPALNYTDRDARRLAASEEASAASEATRAYHPLLGFALSSDPKLKLEAHTEVLRAAIQLSRIRSKVVD